MLEEFGMTVWITTILGVSFLVLAIASTYLMFKLWGYPFDKEAKKSEAPKWAMTVHRCIGYAYAIIYVIMMIKMVPRLWQYQIEFPPRTVAHIMLGLSIGVILILKISILRWFRHFEEWMPTLGVSLLLCTVLLTALSIPNVLKEQTLAAGISDESRQRIAKLLERLDLPAEPTADQLASRKWLEAGRQVLLDECVFCHDLKTAIAKPRPPADWLRTVTRMQEKPSLGPIIDDREALAVTAYLVAITPDLQRSAKARRTESVAEAQSLKALEMAKTNATAGSVDLEAAKELFMEECSLCHDLSDVEEAPPLTAPELDSVIERMIVNGMELKSAELAAIRAYLEATYVK